MKAWTPDEMSALCALRNKGLSGRRIHALMPQHSRHAITVKARRLGIPLLGKHTPPRNRPPEPPRRLTPDEKFQAALAGRAFDALVMRGR